MKSTKEHVYLAVDLKSFYASVECRERGLDPLDTNLVVADESRTDKTICLAVTPSLKSCGIPGRGRLFEVRQRIKTLNQQRRYSAPNQQFSGTSTSDAVLREHPELAVDFIIAPPRMSHYMEYSADIYSIYLKYVAPEDIVVYSIDEVFMDVTAYLHTYQMTPRELAVKIILDVLYTTGITATAGIGPNLFLCKAAMDIVAKHLPADENGVRIAELDEMEFRRTLWTHQPLTDFWRIGRGYAKKLEQYGILTMGDIARCSVCNEDLLYRLFGKNAELLIDHAWGWEPCTIEEIKAYHASSHSLCSGQVLHCPYEADRARLVFLEMTDQMVLDLVSRGLVTDRMDAVIGYDTSNFTDPDRKKHYHGKIVHDAYGRVLPEQSHGFVRFEKHTSSTKEMLCAAEALFSRIADPQLLVRRLNLTVGHVIPESEAEQSTFEQLDLFTDYQVIQKQKNAEQARVQKEKSIQRAMIGIRQRFGKNAILKGMNLENGATARDRNVQIGGHRA